MFPQAARVWTPSFVRHCTPALSNQTSVHTNMFPSLDSWAGNDKRAPGHCQQSTEESDYTIFKRQDHQIVNTLEREWIILSLFPSVQHRTWCPREPSEFTDSDFLNEPATSCFTQPKYTETVAKVKPTTETIGSQCLSNTDSSGATSEWRAQGGVTPSQSQVPRNEGREKSGNVAGRKWNHRREAGEVLFQRYIWSSDIYKHCAACLDGNCTGKLKGKAVPENI